MISIPRLDIEWLFHSGARSNWFATWVIYLGALGSLLTKFGCKGTNIAATACVGLRPLSDEGQAMPSSKPLRAAEMLSLGEGTLGKRREILRTSHGPRSVAPAGIVFF